MKRTKLIDRKLPSYTLAEERMNMLTHIAGTCFAVAALIMCILKTRANTTVPVIVAVAIYCISIMLVFAVSSIYHGLRAGIAKKVLQIIDHCMIYLLIAGTYTPIIVLAFMPKFPITGLILLVSEWGLGCVASVLTAIDLKKHKVFSMVSYIFMGWCIIFFLPQAVTVLGYNFRYILAGGITYTVGAILFGIGTKIRWLHTVFHFFVILGCLLQFIGIYCML
jgi:hemolysin III